MRSFGQVWENGFRFKMAGKQRLDRYVAGRRSAVLFIATVCEQRPAREGKLRGRTDGQQAA